MFFILSLLVGVSGAEFTNIRNSGSHSFPSVNITLLSISKTKCPFELELPSSLECATFSVPIDWHAPYGEHFNLGFVKLPAIPSNSNSKVDSLPMH
jgi:hypothetical protein